MNHAIRVIYTRSFRTFDNFSEVLKAVSVFFDLGLHKTIYIFKMIWNEESGVKGMATWNIGIGVLTSVLIFAVTAATAAALICAAA